MQLAFNPRSRHVKVNRVVVGVVDENDFGVIYRHFAFKDINIQAPTLKELLPMVREFLIK